MRHDEDGGGGTSLPDLSMEMEITPNEMVHYSSSGREGQRFVVLQNPRILSWKGRWRRYYLFILKLYTIVILIEIFKRLYSGLGCVF